VSTAQQAAQEVAASSSALPTTTGPGQSQLFDLFKMCANPLATAAGYRQVPMSAPITAGAPLNSPKTCGLAKDPVSAGCPHRDYVLAFCTRAGERFEPLTKMTPMEMEIIKDKMEEQAAQEASAQPVPPEEEGFFGSKAALGVAAVVVGTLVFMEYRRRNRPKKNARRSPRKNGKRPSKLAFEIARHVMAQGTTPYQLTKRYRLSPSQATVIDAHASAYGGPGGKSEEQFARFVDKVLASSRPLRNGSLRKGDRVEIRKVWAYAWPEPSKEWFKGYVFVKLERGGKDAIVIGTRGVFSGEPIRVPASDVRKER
jgi:hypothetical protein